MYSYGCFNPGRVPAGTIVGRYCSFAEGVVIFNANHPLERPSLHPFFYNPKLGIVEQETIVRGTLHIGNDVWIGRNALILPHVRSIGNGAVIGAGAIVTKDVPAYAIVAGNPARIIRWRFPDAIQQQLERSRWWERSIEELRREVDTFVQPVSAKTLAHLVPMDEQS
jgi:acetyltransferase-like isoleucine patch superfamily enzyme